MSESVFADYHEWRRNEHGVEVTTIGYGRGEGVFPRCCVSCPHLDADGDLDGYWSAYFCTRNVILPTRTGRCKVKERTPRATGEDQPHA